MAKGGTTENTYRPSYLKMPQRTTTGVQITSVGETPTHSSISAAAAAQPVVEEEETSCYTSTTQSVVVTRYPGKSKPAEQSEASCSGSSRPCTALQKCDVGDVIQGRAREKFELQRLNDRLSSFIERVSSLYYSLMCHITTWCNSAC